MATIPSPEDAMSAAVNAAPQSVQNALTARTELYFMGYAVVLGYAYRETILDGEDDWGTLDLLSVLFLTYMVRRLW